MTSVGLRDRLLLCAWLVWAAFLLRHYYQQLSPTLASGGFPTARTCAMVVIPFVLGALAVAMAIRIRIAPGPRRVRMLFASAALATVPWLLMHPFLLRSAETIALPGAPAIGEAIARAAIGTAGALLVGASAIAAGALALRLLRWQSPSRIERLVFAWTTGMGIISYGCLLLAAVGAYRPLPVALFIGALLLTGAVPWPVLQPVIEEPDDGPLDGVTIAWLCLIAVALLYALVAAFAPEKEFDALWYHLYLPRIWLEAGRPVDVIQEFPSLYPLTWELIFGAGMTLGGVVGAKLLHFTCLPLLAALVWRAARFAGRIPAAAAAAFVVTTPTLLWEASTTYIDLALALHVSAAGYALARHLEDEDRPWALVAALQLGLAAATKHLGIIAAIVSVTLFAIAAVRRGRPLHPVMRTAALIALIAALIPSPWYLRSWLASGNPVFPEMYGVFGAAPPERWDARAAEGLERFTERFGFGRSIGALAALPWNVTVQGGSFGGSLGPLFLVLLPALLVPPHRVRGLRWVAAGVAAYVAVWASPVSSFQMRFLMPIVPPLALLAAAALDRTLRLAAGLPGAAALITAATMVLAALNLPVFTRLHEGGRVWLTHVLRTPPIDVVAGRVTASAYLGRQVPAFAAWRAIDAGLPQDARVLTFSEGDLLYGHRWRVSHYAPLARPAVWDAGAAEVASAAETLRRLRITHVLFDRRELSPERAGSLALASPAFQQACSTEFDDGRFWLCRVDYSRLPRPAPRP